MTVMGFRIQPLVAWFDMWIGVYWDRDNRRAYVFPVPCLGFTVERVR